MAQAQILQATILSDFFRRLTDYNDNELAQVKQCAMELRDGKYIKAVNSEMNRRIKEG